MKRRKGGDSKRLRGEAKLNALHEPTLAELHMACKMCPQTTRLTLATYVVYVECDHGIYTYQHMCEAHWVDIDGWQSSRLSTLHTTFYNFDHDCTTAFYVARLVVPNERRYLAAGVS